MRDWSALVEKRLAGLALEPNERAEVIAEVATHLEDICEEVLRQGMTEDEAVQRALLRVGDWRDLKRKISAAKRSEQAMKKRLRQLWIPGFLTLILSMFILMMLQRLGFEPRIVGSGPNAILLYMPWLLLLLPLGALGAHLSLLAGGSRRRMLLASVFPALAFAFAFLVMSPIGWGWERITGTRVDFDVVAAALLRDSIGWLVVPGAALLVGGLLAHAVSGARPSSRSVAIV